MTEQTAARESPGGDPPQLEIRKLGIVSRDFSHTFPNGYRDFSFVLPDVLALLDDLGCDAVLFASYSIVPRIGYDPVAGMNPRNVKAVFYDEFEAGADGSRRSTR